MIPRQAAKAIQSGLALFPAVALLGPRQVGKTTLALQVAQAFDPNFIYLDLESELDQAKLALPRAFLAEKMDRLVVIDEVHRKPGLFPELRGLIDAARREGKKAGHYLLLGSASLELLKQSGETLAGRILYTELPPLQVSEIPHTDINQLWLRGGFPESFLAATEAASIDWRRSFVRSYLERDIGQFFTQRISANDLRRLWTMLAHQQAMQVNMAALSRSLGLDQKTVKNYLSLLGELLLLRQLPAWHTNIGKRLVKTPKTFIRDSGLVHSLLGITSVDSLLAHPIAGGSWEAFVAEQIANASEADSQIFFYRTGGGAEIDVVLERPSGELWAIEVKRSLKPTLSKGFHQACADLQPRRKLVITPGEGRWWVAEDIEAMDIGSLITEL
ncbi:MAG: ATP-binding protein [Betaproteobacteria bacterium]|nr:ATP-binding protein [Betaproteobacteria bacterium]